MCNNKENLKNPTTSDENKFNKLTTNFSHLLKEPTDISQHILSIQDAATYLGIASDELWKVVNDPKSKIPHFQVGKSRCFFTKEGLDKWLEGSYILNFHMN